MWLDGVVVDAPAPGQHAQFFHRVEDLSGEELISELGVPPQRRRPVAGDPG